MTNATLPTTEQIEQRAYALYLERGGEEGHALEDWLAAERELTEQSTVAERSDRPEQSVSAAPKARAAGASQGSMPTATGSAQEASLK